MNWIEWAAIVFVGLVLADFVFISAIVILDWLNDWRRRRENHE